MVFARDLGMVCEINAFHSGTEMQRNLPDVFFPLLRGRKNAAGPETMPHHACVDSHVKS